MHSITGWVNAIMSRGPSEDSTHAVRITKNTDVSDSPNFSDGGEDKWEFFNVHAEETRWLRPPRHRMYSWGAKFRSVRQAALPWVMLVFWVFSLCFQLRVPVWHKSSDKSLYLKDNVGHLSALVRKRVKISLSSLLSPLWLKFAWAFAN